MQMRWHGRAVCGWLQSPAADFCRNNIIWPRQRIIFYRTALWNHLELDSPWHKTIFTRTDETSAGFKNSRQTALQDGRKESANGQLAGSQTSHGQLVQLFSFPKAKIV